MMARGGGAEGGEKRAVRMAVSIHNCYIFTITYIISPY
jgi:hypothetical protein